MSLYIKFYDLIYEMSLFHSTSVRFNKQFYILYSVFQQSSSINSPESDSGETFFDRMSPSAKRIL